MHERFRDKTSPGDARRRQLILDLSLAHSDRPVSRADLLLISPRVAKAYADKTSKTLARDINALEEMKLLRKEEGGYRANKEIILAFLPESTQSENLLRTLLEQERLFLGQTEMRNLAQAERQVSSSAAAAATKV